MSRIGKLPIAVPQGVTVDSTQLEVNVKGPKGQLNLKLVNDIKLEKKGETLVVTRTRNDKNVKSIHGLYRVLINNMITGVSKGFEKKLEIVGTGYRANVQGRKVMLSIGYSYPYEYDIPEGLNITVDNNTTIIINGIDKQLVGQAASDIRKMRPPEPYKGKGIKYSDEVIRRKAGKSTK